MEPFDFLTNKLDFLNSRWAAAPRLNCPEDGAVVEIERLALTANNLTYAKSGESFRFWDYFPAESGWGRIPFWGIGRVVQARCADLSEGERIYGFLPISTHVALLPVSSSATAFVDAAPHRAALPPTYNEYRRVDRDAALQDGADDAFLVLRPLFSLGFFLAAWLEEEAYFGARQILVTSASSKAASAVAHQLPARIERIGLTAAGNVASVKQVGMFDEIVAYSDIAGDPAIEDLPTLLIDIAGDPDVACDVENRCGPALLRTIAVGATRAPPGRQWPPRDERAHVEFFFAPAHILRLRESWGKQVLRERLSAGMADFTLAMKPWLRRQAWSGRAEIARVYDQLTSGRLSPRLAAILTDPTSP